MDESDELFLLYSTLNVSCVLDELPDRDTLSSHWTDLFRADYVASAALVLIFLAGVPLNCYILAQILHKRLYSNPTYLLLLNLGFVDLLTCLIPILFNIVLSFNGEISFGRSDYTRCQVCKIVTAYILLTLQSAYNLALISVERLIFFRSPLQYSSLVTSKRVLLALLVIWFISIAFTIPPLAGYGDLAFSVSCGYIFLTTPHLDRSLVYLFVCATFQGIVVIVLVVTNIWIVVIAMKSTRRVKGIRVTPYESAKSRNSRISPFQSTKTSKSRSDHVSPFQSAKSRNSQNSTIFTSHVEQQVDLVRRRLSREVAKKQLRLCQVFGSIILVNIVTLIPAFVLIIVTVSVSFMQPTFAVFVQISVFSQVVLHPLVEISLALELRRVIVKWCRPFMPHLNSLGKSTLGRAFSSCCSKVRNYCKSDSWTKALAEELSELNLDDTCIQSEPLTVYS